MKGDFSRSGIEHLKGYSGVLMQQGRVLLDADWNEQVAIVRHAIEIRTRDLLGLSGTPEGEDAPEGGFKISVSGGKLVVGTGHFYVDGLLCENTKPAPIVPSLGSQEDRATGPTTALVYLDIWEDHVTALENPQLRDPALGGVDTATRTQTLWQVALLPLAALSGKPPAADNQPDTHAPPGWKSFLAECARSACMSARIKDSDGGLANQLYRVEIHSVKPARFKWSRENGAIAFPIDLIELAATDQSGSAILNVRLLQLERDPRAITAGDMVEIEDALSGVGKAPTLLALVTEVDMQPGVGDHIGQMVAYLKLRAVASQAISLSARLSGNGDAGLKPDLHPVLRRWDRSEGSSGQEQLATAMPSLTVIEADRDYPIEHGLTVSFGEIEDLRPGDYWQLTTRTDQVVSSWPSRLPDGPAHHYAPLALIGRTATGWQVLKDLRRCFPSVPDLSAKLEKERERLDDAKKTIGSLHARIERMDADMAGLRALVEDLAQRLKQVRGQVEQEYIADAEITQWSVVSADPERAAHIERASESNPTLLIGVVAEVRERPGASGPTYRVVSYGRVYCRVKGAVKPGDLLVVSDLPGYACRAGVYVQPGTLLGKALAVVPPDDDGVSELIDAIVTLG